MNNQLRCLASNSFKISTLISMFQKTNPFHTTSNALVKLTNTLNAEPTKAKKRIDPAVLALRENRRKKRIEKEIKKMEKIGRKLKPIEELEPDRVVLKEVNLRKRAVGKLGKEQEDDEFFLKKEWANYMAQLHKNQMNQLQKALQIQEKALNELKKDNMDLYFKAIQLDNNLIPYVREGPVLTPPLRSYEPPEGDYSDVTYLYDRKPTSI